MQVQEPLALHEIGAWNAQRTAQGPVQSESVAHIAIAAGTLQVVVPLLLLADVLAVVDVTVVAAVLATAVEAPPNPVVLEPPRPLVLEPPSPLVDEPPSPLVLEPPMPLVDDPPAPGPVLVLVLAPVLVPAVVVVVVLVPVPVLVDEPVAATPTPNPPAPPRSDPCAQLRARRPPIGKARRRKARMAAGLSQGSGAKGRNRLLRAQAHTRLQWRRTAQTPQETPLEGCRRAPSRYRAREG